MQSTQRLCFNFFFYGLFVLALALFWGCGKPEPETRQTKDGEKIVTLRPPYARCSERDGFLEYLGAIGQKTKAHWQLPEPLKELQPPYKVHIDFSIDADGSLREASASGDEDARLKSSAVKAIRAAQPFGALPENLECISEMEGLGIIITHPSSPN